ncbi:Ribonuclease H protein [Quillaja saponaria]|uniref:Ribonuclease H protein n=1 Tax=Quillaja saponaria TaxID=32244 RepID=A0AAD7PLX6_QUISA|nr:Ribonuclease H protein [Quillaja saponaria]
MQETVRSYMAASGEWDMDKLQAVVPYEVGLHVKALLPPSIEGQADYMAWGLASNGIFSIHSAYDLIASEEFVGNTEVWKIIWQWKGPARVRQFLWLAMRNGLTTNSVQARCMDVESVIHVLRDLPSS